MKTSHVRMVVLVLISILMTTSVNVHLALMEETVKTVLDVRLCFAYLCSSYPPIATFSLFYRPFSKQFHIVSNSFVYYINNAKI